MRRRAITHKFKAKPVTDDGSHFSSKLEHRYYQRLKLLQQAGEIVFFTRQCPFHLPGGVKYVVDFVEYHADGSVHFIDVKGMDTPLSIAKRKMVESIYPVEIEVVKKF